jgi:hypothetical protein
MMDPNESWRALFRKASATKEWKQTQPVTGRAELGDEIFCLQRAKHAQRALFLRNKRDKRTKRKSICDGWSEVGVGETVFL